MNLSPIARAVSVIAPETDAGMTLAERPERLHGVWSPLERLLDQIEATGEIDAARGIPVFREAGSWHAVGPALAGVTEFHEIAQQRYGVAVDTRPLAKLGRKLEHGVPVFAADLAAARECIRQCKQQAAQLTVAQAVDVVRTVQISIEMERRRNDQHNRTPDQGVPG